MKAIKGHNWKFDRQIGIEEPPKEIMGEIIFYILGKI
jgi:hypothetical protein